MAETREAVERIKEREKSEWMPAPSGDFSFFLTGALKVGYRCPTNPSASLSLSLAPPQRREPYSATWSPPDRGNKLGPKETEKWFSLV